MTIKALFHRGQTVVQFFAAQGLTMAANMLYGLLCVRLLPASEYAKFVVVFGVQATLIILMDVNLSGTLIPLIGERVDNHKLIADYVAALRQISIWAYVLVAAGTVVFFPLLVRNRQWSIPAIAGMIAILLLSTWFMRVSSAYGTVCVLLRDRKKWYKGQLISSIGTLVLLLAFWALHWLGAYQAILINVAGIVFTGLFYFYRARTLLGVVGIATRHKRNAIFRLALPNMPQAIFFALQGQISLFLITFLGHTQGVASVGALGRLGGIFAVFSQANQLLVEPFFAKLPRHKLRSNYAAAVALAAVVSTGILVFTLHFPQLLLWVLGPQYANLEVEVKLSITASAISCFSGVLWGIHSSRRFVYWWNVIFSISLTILVQVLFILKADMSTVRGVLWLNLATNLASLAVNISSGVYGFLRGPRVTELTSEVHLPESAIEAESVNELYPLEAGSIPSHALPRIVQPEVLETGAKRGSKLPVAKPEE